MGTGDEGMSNLVRRQSQKDRVLARLQRGQRITPMDALRDFGCFRLASVIHKLRSSEGYAIITVPTVIDDKHFATYHLAGL
mgnify:CR=1 FL=1